MLSNAKDGISTVSLLSPGLPRWIKARSIALVQCHDEGSPWPDANPSDVYSFCSTTPTQYLHRESQHSVEDDHQANIVVFHWDYKGHDDYTRQMTPKSRPRSLRGLPEPGPLLVHGGFLHGLFIPPHPYNTHAHYPQSRTSPHLHS